MRLTSRRQEVPCRVRPLVVVPALEFAVDHVEMPLRHDHEFVEAFKLSDRTRTPFPATVVVKLDRSGIGGAQIWFEWPLDGEARECFWPVMSD